MTPTTVQLWERIHAAGLATPDECRLWAIEISKSSLESLQDPNRLASELIRLRKITSFQANVLFGNLPIPLTTGRFQITESLESSLGEHWLKAIDTSRSKRPSCWCYFLNPESLSTPEVRSWPPSLRLAPKQIDIAHPSLDKWHLAGIDKTNFVAVCDALEGKSLSELLNTRTLSWSESVSMVEQVAAGLQKMHDAGMVHGRIGVDSIWCIDESEFVLRRDPVFPPANPYLSQCNSVFWDRPNGDFSTAAPELTLPNSPLTFQSDLYALGCVWYQSIARSSPYGVEPDATFQVWAKAHFSQRFRPLSQAVLPQSLQKCLSHLLAKNPSARFATAFALIHAIEFAVDESNKQIDTPVESKTLPPKPAILDPAIASVPQTKSPQLPTNKAVPNLAQTEQGTSASRAKSSPVAKLDSIPKPPEKSVANDQVNSEEFVVAEIASPDFKKSTTLETPLSGKRIAEPVLAKNVTGGSTLEARAKKSLDNAKPKSKKKKSKKKKKPIWLIPAMICGTCLIFGAIISVLLLKGNNGVEVARTPVVVNEPNQAPPTSTPGTGPQGTGGNLSPNPPGPSTPLVTDYFIVEPDDGQLLWAPPHAGSPYSLEMLPAGVEGMVFVSGNLWHRRGNAAGISKWWLDIQPDLAKQVAANPLGTDDRISSVAIALLPSKKPGVPQAVFRFSYSQPVSVESIAQRLTGFSMQLFDPKNEKRKGLWSNESATNPQAALMEDMQTESNAMVQRVVFGSQDTIATLPELNGAPAPVRRQMETLLKLTDSQSDLTLLFAPSFLFGDGRELLATEPKLQTALRDSIDETMQAVMFTTTIEPRWYMELRMLSSETRDAGKFSASLKATLGNIPDGFEKGLSSGSVVHPYWRAIGLRYPQMMRTLNRFGRFGLEDGQVVTNVYLPSDAMSNIAIASWMALQNPVADAGTAIASPTKPTTKPPSKSIDEILESKISIGFEQESLEAALQLVAGEVTDSVLAGAAITMNINGTAFQKEGITRNQSIRSFKHDGDTLRNVLMDLVRRANPVTTVKSPTEQNQKVVWLILDDPERPGQKKIELTTRTWATGNNASLPKEFVAE